MPARGPAGTQRGAKKGVQTKIRKEAPVAKAAKPGHDPVTFWEKAPTSDDGVTGGFPEVAKACLQATLAFVRDVHAGRSFDTALDLASGYGRCAAGVLRPAGFQTIHLVERSAAQCRAAAKRTDLGPKQVFNKSMQDFAFPRQYNFILANWALMYLNDRDALALLKRCKTALIGDPRVCHDGTLVVKENVYKPVDLEKPGSQEDGAYTRTAKQWRELFAKAGLRVVKARYQQDWPTDLEKVLMFALRP